MKVHLLLKENYALFLLAFLLMNLINSNSYSQGIVVTEESGTISPHSSSILDVRAVNKGLLVPRMTSDQRIAIASAANGLLVYDLNENQFFYYNSDLTQWVKAVGPQGPQGFLEPGSAIGNTPYWNGSQWVLNSNNLYHNGTRVGIGTNNPIGKLDIRLANGSDYVNIQRTTAGFGPIIDLFGYSNTHKLRIEYTNTSVYNFIVDDVNRHISFNPSGNFGIGLGTVAPSRKLDVNGDVRFRAHLFDYNNSSGTSGQVLTRGASGIVWASAENVSGTGIAGRMAYWSSASNIDALPFMNYNTASQFVEVTSKTVANDDDPIFEVRNKDGLIVFGVYQTGVRIYVDDSAVKTARGGFAVGGFTNQKDKSGIEYLKVTPDSVRVYVDVDDTKTARGGFAVGGFTTAKTLHDLLRITPDSARIYVKTGTGKTARGGFAVGGYTTGKEKGASDFMYLTPENYFIGHESGGPNVEGLHNSTLGYQTGKALTTGKENIFIGYMAGFSNTSGWGNTAIGYKSLYSNTVGRQNVANGYEALYSSVNGDFNVANGYQALYKNTSGAYNVANGHHALYSNTIGNYNAAYGYKAMYSNITGQDNTAIGYQAMYFNTSAQQSVAIGKETLFNANTNYNVAIGNSALFSNTTGSYNTALGFSAFWGGAAYLNSTALGYGTVINASNQIRVGNASISTAWVQVNWSVGSDSRIKDNIKEDVPGLEFIEQLRPVTYNFNISKQNELLGLEIDDEMVSKYDIEKVKFTGFIAQEVDEAASKIGYDFSGIDKSGPVMGLKYAEFTAPLIKAVQELNRKIGDQQQQIEFAESQNQKLELELEILKSELESFKSEIEAIKSSLSND